MPKSIEIKTVPPVAPNNVSAWTTMVTLLILFSAGAASGAPQPRCAINLLAPVAGVKNARTHVDFASVVDFVEEKRVRDHVYDIHARVPEKAAEILASRVHFDTPATRTATAVMCELAAREKASLSMARSQDFEPHAVLSLDLANDLPPATHVVRVHKTTNKSETPSMIWRLDVDVYHNKIYIFTGEAYGDYQGADFVVDDQTGHGPSLTLSLGAEGVPVIQSEMINIKYFNGTKNNPRLDQVLSLARKLAQRIYPQAMHFNLQAVGGSLELTREASAN